MPEKAWSALIQTQKNQMDMLNLLLEQTQQLATWNDLSNMQEGQIEQLTAHAKVTEQTLTEFQTTLQQQAEQIQTATLT